MKTWWKRKRGEKNVAVIFILESNSIITHFIFNIRKWFRFFYNSKYYWKLEESSKNDSDMGKPFLDETKNYWLKSKRNRKWKWWKLKIKLSHDCNCLGLRKIFNDSDRPQNEINKNIKCNKFLLLLSWKELLFDTSR